MAKTHAIGWNYITGGETLGGQLSAADEGENNIDVSIPAATDDVHIDLAIDVSQVKSLLFKADQDLTLDFNNAGPDPAPAFTISLKADIPLIWESTAGYWANPLTEDVTAIYASNAHATAAAALKIRVLRDATP